MNGIRHWGVRMLFVSLLLSAGCVDAVREGVTTGVTSGVAGVVSAFFDALVGQG